MARLQVEMTDQAYASLQQAAAQQGRTVSELVRRSLNIEAFLREQATSDPASKVMVVSGDGREQEVKII